MGAPRPASPSSIIFIAEDCWEKQGFRTSSRYWHCSAFADCWARHPRVRARFLAEGSTWRQCFLSAGLMPEHPEVAALQRDLGIFSAPLPRRPAVPPFLPDELFDRQGRVYVFTDGGAIHGSNARFTRCGGGAFWGRDHPFNFKCPLWGAVQGPDRAEQYMVLAVPEFERRRCTCVLTTTRRA